MRKISVLLSLVIAAASVAAQTPSPALLVLNKSENTLSIVDPATRKTIATVPTGDGPHEVATDGKLAFVTNYSPRASGNTLSIIDIGAQKELRRFDLGALRGPHGIEFKSGKVYFTAEGSKEIARYDPAANKIDWHFSTGQEGTHMLVLSRDGNKIFTANIGSDSVSAIERHPGSDQWKATVIRVGKGPEGIDISPDGKEVWTAHSRDGGISIIDAQTNQVVQTFDIHTKRSNRVKFSPDGKLVLVSDLDAGELIILNARARKEVKRLKLGPGTEGILVPSDGARAYVAVAGENQVAMIDLKALDVVDRIKTGKGPDGMAWAK